MSDELYKFRELWSDLDGTLVAFRVEARELREAVSSPEIGETIDTIHERLVEARRSQDRLEAIVADVGWVRARVKKLVSQLEDEYDDKWREVYQATRVGEYSSAEERNATYKTGAIQELVNLRQAKRMYDDVEAVYQYVNVKFRGVDSARRDSDTRLRAISVAGHLES